MRHSELCSSQVFFFVKQAVSSLYFKRFQSGVTLNATSTKKLFLAILWHLIYNEWLFGSKK